MPAIPRRRPPRVLAAASAALLAAVGGLWARSYWVYDEVIWTRRHNAGGAAYHWSAGLVSESGRLSFHTQWYMDEHPAWLPGDWPVPGRAEHRAEWRTLAASAGRYDHLSRWGFHAGAIVRDDLVSRGLLVPHWLPSLALWLLVAIGVAGRRRHPPGHCESCGYDLTANASGRCPECGTAAAPGPVATDPLWPTVPATRWTTRRPGTSDPPARGLAPCGRCSG
jgi:hypothetical protein